MENGGVVFVSVVFIVVVVVFVVIVFVVVIYIVSIVNIHVSNFLLSLSLSCIQYTRYIWILLVAVPITFWRLALTISCPFNINAYSK